MTEFETDCKYGQHRIKMVGSKSEGWKPYNLDGTPHNCKGQSKPKGPEEHQEQLRDTGKMVAEAEARVREIAREEIVRFLTIAREIAESEAKKKQ